MDKQTKDSIMADYRNKKIEAETEMTKRIREAREDYTKELERLYSEYSKQYPELFPGVRIRRG